MAMACRARVLQFQANTILEFDVKFNEAKLSSTEATRLAADTVAIDNYLQSKSITAIKDSTGLRYVITTPGTGPMASWYDKLTLKYSIKLLTDDTKTIVSWKDRQAIRFIAVRSTISWG